MNTIFKFIFYWSTLTIFIVFFSSNIVYADEFSLGIIIDPSYTDSTRQEFLNGFQLSVNESPDISHPTGEEGGDHLGGLDVKINIADIEEAQEKLTVDAIETVMDAAIVIVDLEAENLAFAHRSLVGSNSFLISLQNNQDVTLSDSLYFYEMTQLHDTKSLFIYKDPSFKEKYLELYGSMDTLAARRGYVAGRMVDLAVEATDRDPADVATMNKKLDELIVNAEPPNNIPTEQKAETTTQQGTQNTESKIEFTWYLFTVITAVLLVATAWLLNKYLLKNWFAK